MRRSTGTAICGCSYLAGLGAHLYRSDVIYADMLRYSSTYPNNLFVGSEPTLASLREGIRRMQGK